MIGRVLFHRGKTLAAHKLLFCLNAGSFIAAIGLLYGSRAFLSNLYRIEDVTQTWLKLNQTDVHKGYVALFVPAVVISVVIWVGWHLLVSRKVLSELLRSYAGLAALALAPSYRLLGTYSRQGTYGWLLCASEVVLILLVMTLTLYTHYPQLSLPWWITAVIAMSHYVLWLRQFGTYFVFSGYDRAIVFLPVMGLASTLAWLCYIKQAGTEEIVMAPC